MKKIVLFFVCINTFSGVFSQAPEIEWQNTIGGSGSDKLTVVRPTSDGGFILGGSSDSPISGDKTEDFIPGDTHLDCWVIKTDVSGNIIWQNTIGGNRNDAVADIRQTSDGGYIIAATTNSGISGDKTEAHHGGTCCNDYWIIKLDASGNILWQNTIGGSQRDDVKSIMQTPDGGYIVGGDASSPADGDKTEGVIGGDTFIHDYWILKLDAAGNIVWQNTVGGTGQDYLTSIDITSDGGYIIGGYSTSGASGDKTEGIVFAGSYFADFWIIKLNSTGSIVWQNTIGGGGTDYSPVVHQTTDGGYIVGGYSDSGIFGDKTEVQIGGTDLWILKLNSTGGIVWQNTIGGTANDYLRSIDQTTDGGYVIGAYSASALSGDKSEYNMGSDDYWALKLNSSGNILWQNTIGGNGLDDACNFFPVAAGGYLLAGYSYSNIYGDKSENGQGSNDYWITKLNFCVPEVCNGYDDNCNGSIDEGITTHIEIATDDLLTFCQGGSAELYISGFSGTPNYQWKKNGSAIAGATANNYIATAKGNYSCSASGPCGTITSSSIFVNVLKLPAANITAGGPTTFCAGGSVLLSATTGTGLTYQWRKSNVNITGATNSNYTATAAGTYKCNVTNASGCTKLSNGIHVTITCREIEDVSDMNEIIIFPNPVRSGNALNINLEAPELNSSDEVSLEIFNTVGGCVVLQSLPASDGAVAQTIELKLPSGMYFIQLSNENFSSRQKLIVE